MDKVILDNKPVCRTCGATLEAQTPAIGEKAYPRPNDLSVCMYCATAGYFDSDLNIIPLSSAMLLEIEYNHPTVHKQLVEAQKAVRWSLVVKATGPK